MKNKKIIFSLIACFVLLLTSVGMVSCYERIEKASINEVRSEAITTSLLNIDILGESIYAISEDLDKANQDEVAYEDKYLQFEMVQGGIDKDKNKQEAIQNIKRNSFAYFQEKTKNEPNLKYYAVNTINHKQVTNDNNLQFMSENDKKYAWYIQCNFDENGVLSINGEEIDTQNIASAFTRFQTNNIYTDVDQYGAANFNVTLKTPKNLSILYAVPKDMVKSGDLYWQLENISANRVTTVLIPYALICLFVILLFILFSPITIMKECNPFKSLARIKFEILCFFGFLGIAGGIYFPTNLLLVSQNGTLKEGLNTVGLGDLSEGISSLLNVGLWILLFGGFMFGIFLIKYIFNKGFINYLKENTIVGYLYLNCHRIIDRIMNFDINEIGNKAILKIVLVNLIFITLINFFFDFGFFISIIYSIILFVLLKKKFLDIRDDYCVLLKATKRISNGDFNVEIYEDLGMFNSLRDEFTNIKEGFEKAVNEEVKSQRMKTELVSNVSHDLKTPLTSIITYVDLLKKSDLKEEERKQYIDTIDRNSVRLKNLIDDLFEVSKANSGNVSLNIVDVDIVSLIKQAQFECADKIEEAKLEFKVNFSQEKIVYPLDSSKTYRIFENLLINICKYALANTRVYVDVVAKEKEVEIVFKNISANEIDFNSEDIVERFARGDKSRNSDGSGLGLAIAKSFTQLQKGLFDIEVDGDLFKAIIVFKK